MDVLLGVASGSPEQAVAIAIRTPLGVRSAALRVINVGSETPALRYRSLEI
jgi:hypothetical protein